MSCNIFWPLRSGPHLYGLSAVICIAFFLEAATINSFILAQKLCMCRPRGRSSIIIPAGGATASAWGTFRDALARIELAGQQVLSSVPLHVEKSSASCCFDPGSDGHMVTKATFACSALDTHHALSSCLENIVHVSCK